MGIVAILNLRKRIASKAAAKKQEEVEKLARQKVQEIMKTGKPEEYVKEEEEKAKKPIKKYIIFGSIGLVGIGLIFVLIRAVRRRKK